MATKQYDVEVQPDFLERQTRAHPIQGVSELIWNALDADATNVEVRFEDDGLGAMSRIIVSDNGHGISFEDAPALFKNLGGSWKKTASRTHQKHRMLHGQEGRGRFRALALGAAVDWNIVYDAPAGRRSYKITMLENEIRYVRITDEEPAPTAKRGVTATISDLKRNFVSLVPPDSLQDFAEVFAIYLKNYRDVAVSIGGIKLDPSLAIANQRNVVLTPIVDDNGNSHPVHLELIEWKGPTKRALYLCSEAGIPLSQVEARFHVGDYQFSAYLKSSFISALHEGNQLELGELLPVLLNSIEEARAQIKLAFRERAAEKAKVVVDEWKAQNIYPFSGEAASPVEKAERQIFEIVAVTVQDATPEFRETPRSQVALHLRMLRHAIERSPGELQKILDEVLKLPRRKQQELASLLEETDLSGIISAATLVADRLKFLEGLRHILFDFEAKQKLKERAQLHKILEQNTWVFGEEYNLWASDKELTTVLKAHKNRLDPTLIIDEPVKVINKSRGVLDLMMSRAQRRHRSDDIEHLVIELKAPKVKVKAEHLTQTEGYALAVEEDPRFNRVQGLKWHFWVVSDEYDNQVAARIRNGPDPARRLVQKGDRVTVGVKTWGEILEENNARLQFVREKLEHRADEGKALEFLQEKHKQFLEGIIVEQSTRDPSDTDAELEPS